MIARLRSLQLQKGHLKLVLRFLTLGTIVVVFASSSSTHSAGAPNQNRLSYPWLSSAAQDTVEARIPPPPGFIHISTKPGSFAEWLRRLPVKPAGSPVLLFNGRQRLNQTTHWAVINIDVGTEDLQQCADAVIRLRAEYLFSIGCDEMLAFDLTNGTRATWSSWRDGKRPKLMQGNNLLWMKGADRDGSYANFRRYLDTVFRYAGTASLSRELERISDPKELSIGDIFVKAGFPGHSVIITDIVENSQGRRLFLLAQSFMPAQSLHILRNPVSWQTPWFELRPTGSLRTPDWTFSPSELKRFPEIPCRTGY